MNDIMAENREFLGSAELYGKIVARPEWRVMEGIPRETERAIPLQFVYDEEGLRFFHDTTATAMHKHATCWEIIDAVGDIDPETFDADVLIAEHDEDFDCAHKCSKVVCDDSAKWIKILPA